MKDINPNKNAVNTSFLTCLSLKIHLGMKVIKKTIEENVNASVSLTVGSKIIRAFKMIRLKKLISNAILRNNFCQIMIFRLNIDYNKHQMIRIDSKTWEKLQVLE